MPFQKSTDDLDVAAQWFAAIESGTADLMRFEAWRNASPRHAVAYARIVAGWEALGEQRVKTDPLVLDTPSLRAAKAPLARPVSRRQWMKVAAVGIPVAAMGTTFFAQRALAWQTEQTGIGEMRKVVLPDGSHLDLNTDSLLSWKFTRNERRFVLKRGEIALNLQPGRTSVLEGDGASSPLGAGLFHAELKPPHALQLTLVERSAVAGAKRGQGPVVEGTSRTPSSEGSQPALPIGLHETVTLSPDLAPTVRQRTTLEAEALLAWRQGEIVFLDIPLSEAVARFNRYLMPDNRIAVPDTDLAREHVGGRFALNDPDEFLHTIALALDAHVHREPSGYVLTP